MSDYLTEARLGEYVSERYPGIEIIFDKKVPELGFRPDIYIPSKKLVIEFDGFRHFTENSTILKDINKERILMAAGIKSVRIPYFIQLDNDTTRTWFGDCDILVADGDASYPHGFIDDKAGLPGIFSSLGLKKFEIILCGQDVRIVREVMKSLHTKLIKGKFLLECFPNFFERDAVFNGAKIIEILNDIGLTIPGEKISEGSIQHNFMKP